jgi:hypothetical protein
VAIHQDPRGGDLLADDCQGAFEFGVVAGEVGGEVRRLAGLARPAALAQVQRVEGEAALGEVIGQLGVEEVVGVAVHRQDRVRPPGVVLGRPAAHQGRDDVAFAVGIGPERDRALPVAGQDVRHPASHQASLEP